MSNFAARCLTTNFAVRYSNRSRFWSENWRFCPPCPVRLGVRTPPFHGGNTGSNPVPVTIFTGKFRIILSKLIRFCRRKSESFVFCREDAKKSGQYPDSFDHRDGGVFWTAERRHGDDTAVREYLGQARVQLGGRELCRRIVGPVEGAVAQCRLERAA